MPRADWKTQMSHLHSRRVFVSSLIVALVLLLSACGSWGVGGASTRGLRVLFIGNSYTYFNAGLDREFEGLLPGAETARVAQPGYTLEQHWADGETLRRIQAGGWQYVVLQEQSQRPVLEAAKFTSYARQLDAAIRAQGGKTVLLMTWQRPDSVSWGVTTANLANAYQQLGKDLGAQVAPVGLAFAGSLVERPSLSLYSEDGHPTDAGTYLASCVLYGVIVGRSPLGNPYVGPGLRADEARFLQRVAAETLGY